MELQQEQQGMIVHLRLTVPRHMVLAELRKELLQCCCNQARTNNGGLIPWNAIPICETFEISYLMGKHLMNGDLENQSKGQKYCLEHWLNIIRFLRRTSQGSINLVRKFAAKKRYTHETTKFRQALATLEKFAKWDELNFSVNKLVISVFSVLRTQDWSVHSILITLRVRNCGFVRPTA